MASRGGQGEARGRMGNLPEDYPPPQGLHLQFQASQLHYGAPSPCPSFRELALQPIEYVVKGEPAPRCNLLLFLPLVMTESKNK